jgi:serine/threonine protein kinase
VSTHESPEKLGRYRILGELGRGAMGVVYSGEDESLGRKVAIKTVLMTFASEEQEGYLARFRQEARAMGALNHPAIVSVYDYGDQGDMAYMAMELLEGRELRDVMKQSRPALALAVDIAAQVAEGLAYAHERGIVHRDIKPGNIMVLDGGRVKIMDFGIARVRASDVKTQTGLMLGSPKYMSPEQIMGQPADHRSDVFSLGVVLYEMLAGAPPFAGADIPQLMYQVCNAQPPPPSHLNPAVPEVIDLIASRALAKDLGARYQDAAALAADLRKHAADLPPEPSSLSVPPSPASDPAAATQALAATMAISPGGSSLGLLPWRRFDSSAALDRLGSPRGGDRALLAPATQVGGWRRWIDSARVSGAGLTAIAVAIAIGIYLY